MIGDVRALAGQVADVVAAQEPGLLTWEKITAQDE